MTGKGRSGPTQGGSSALAHLAAGSRRRITPEVRPAPPADPAVWQARTNGRSTYVVLATSPASSTRSQAVTRTIREAPAGGSRRTALVAAAVLGAIAARPLLAISRGPLRGTEPRCAPQVERARSPDRLRGRGASPGRAVAAQLVAARPSFTAVGQTGAHSSGADISIAAGVSLITGGAAIATATRIANAGGSRRTGPPAAAILCAVSLLPLDASRSRILRRAEARIALQVELAGPSDRMARKDACASLLVTGEVAATRPTLAAVR